MARLARADLVDPAEVAAFHCINRCVRRCFLCGEDPVSGRNYEHRKRWLEERLAFLAGQFGIDVLGFAILSNHFHLILRTRPDVVAAWSDAEVAARWLRLCPVRKLPTGETAEPTSAELVAICNMPTRLAEIRQRLSNISWLMRMIAEPIARRANREDQASGRFWQGRFQSVKLCDEAALLACAAYVDLNPIRAGMAESLEASDFTSVQRRLQSAAEPVESPARRDAWLAPLELDERASELRPVGLRGRTGRRASDLGFLPMTLDDYIELLDWTSRQMKPGKASLPADPPAALSRLSISSRAWLPLATRFGKLFQRVAGGPPSMRRLRQRSRVRFHCRDANLLATG
ncbi:MAG: transposase [Pirellulales bacterium]